MKIELNIFNKTIRHPLLHCIDKVKIGVMILRVQQCHSLDIDKVDFEDCKKDLNTSRTVTAIPPHH